MTARILFIVNLLIAASLVTAASVLTAKGGCLEVASRLVALG